MSKNPMGPPGGPGLNLPGMGPGVRAQIPGGPGQGLLVPESVQRMMMEENQYTGPLNLQMAGDNAFLAQPGKVKAFAEELEALMVKFRIDIIKIAYWKGPHEGNPHAHMEPDDED